MTCTFHRWENIQHSS